MDLVLPMVVLFGISFLAGATCLFGAITRPRARKQLAIMAVVSGATALGFGYVLTSGTVIASDWAGNVKRAALVGSHHSVEMRRLGPYFYGSPEGEAHIEVTYADGAVERCGYFGGFTAWVDTARPLDC